MGAIESAPSSGDKLCSSCAEPIRRGAKICNHCKSFQDWRSYLTMSSSVLALLIALISVATSAVPIVVDALTEKNAHLIFSYQGTTSSYASFFVSNTGSRAGSVDSVILSVPWVQKRGFALKLQGDWPDMISPGGTKLIKAMRVTPVPKGSTLDDCTFSFIWTDFKGIHRGGFAKADCNEIGPFLFDEL